MTIEAISGYTWTDGKLARVLHAKNRFPVKTYFSAQQQAAFPASSVDSGDTVDRWKPFANEVASPTDLSDSANWTPTNMTVGADGQTLDEGTANAAHYIQQAFTFTAVEWVVGVKLQRQDMDGAFIAANDGASSFSVVVDLRDGTLSGAVGTWEIFDLGGNVFEVRGYFTPAAGTGYIRVGGYDLTGASTVYTGTDRTLKVLRVASHISTATLDLSLFGAAEVECVAVAGHNLGDSGGRLTLRHDSNDDAVYTTYGFIDFSDNSPLMYFQSGITSTEWRLLVSRAVLPEIAVIWLGAPLKMQRGIYAGFAPSRMNRNTEILGNLSGSGQLLGRSKQRTTLNASFTWQRLTYSWVRANLDGPNGLIQAAESEPLFIAWRPELTDDVAYLMQASVTAAPSAMGITDLFSMSLSGEALAYE